MNKKIFEEVRLPFEGEHVEEITDRQTITTSLNLKWRDVIVIKVIGQGFKTDTIRWHYREGYGKTWRRLKESIKSVEFPEIVPMVSSSITSSNEVNNVYRGIRERLPDTRNSVTKKLTFKNLRRRPKEDDICEQLVRKIADSKDEKWSSLAKEVLTQALKDEFYDLKIYIHVGLYPDGRVGEVFLKGDRIGTKVSGLLDALSMCISVGLQSGVPLSWYTDKLRRMRFEPYPSSTSDSDVPRATSLVDGIAQWLHFRFVENQDKEKK